MYREPKLQHVLCGLSFCEACHFVRPIPVCKYTQSRRSRVVNMKQIRQRSKAEWCMLCIYAKHTTKVYRSNPQRLNPQRLNP